MDVGISTVKPIPRVDASAVAGLILDTQLESGEIPWHVGGKTDPWDHVEAAMGLGVAGHIEAARAAFGWMRRQQLPDGSWYAAYRNGQPEDRTRDANQSAYIAVGAYHHFLITGDIDYLATLWPTVAR